MCEFSPELHLTKCHLDKHYWFRIEKLLFQERQRSYYKDSAYLIKQRVPLNFVKALNLYFDSIAHLATAGRIRSMTKYFPFIQDWWLIQDFYVLHAVSTKVHIDNLYPLSVQRF